jgi:hypothetical protein
VLAEHDQLPAVALAVVHLGSVLEDARELFPLAVGARITELAGKLLEIGQIRDLLLEIGDSPGGRRLVDQLFLELFELSFLEVIQVGVIVQGTDVTPGPPRGQLRTAPTGSFFTEALLEAFVPAGQGLVDRFRRRRRGDAAGW